MLEKSYNVSIRRMFDLPRETHSFYIEKITDSPHLRSVLIKRFLKFVDKLKASDKTRKMFELIKVRRDVDFPVKEANRIRPYWGNQFLKIIF